MSTTLGSPEIPRQQTATPESLGGDAETNQQILYLVPDSDSAQTREVYSWDTSIPKTAEEVEEIDKWMWFALMVLSERSGDTPSEDQLDLRARRAKFLADTFDLRYAPPDNGRASVPSP